MLCSVLLLSLAMLQKKIDKVLHQELLLKFSVMNLDTCRVAKHLVVTIFFRSLRHPSAGEVKHREVKGQI